IFLRIFQAKQMLHMGDAERRTTINRAYADAKKVSGRGAPPVLMIDRLEDVIGYSTAIGHCLYPGPYLTALTLVHMATEDGIVLIVTTALQFSVSVLADEIREAFDTVIDFADVQAKKT